jgi:hypothetical protein
VWCDNTAAVNILNSSRGSDPILNLISRNLWVLQASLDCNVQFMHISGKLNRNVAARGHKPVPQCAGPKPG